MPSEEEATVWGLKKVIYQSHRDIVQLAFAGRLCGFFDELLALLLKDLPFLTDFLRTLSRLLLVPFQTLLTFFSLAVDLVIRPCLNADRTK